MKTVQFVKEVHQELKKVQWPTRQETVRSTIVIIMVSLAVAVAVGVADYTLTQIMETFVF